jgi:hypothetical protein
LSEKSGKSIAAEALKIHEQAQGRIVYSWTSADDAGKVFQIVVSRPYAVSHYARDPEKVAWIAVGVPVISCEPQSDPQ